MSVSDSVFKHSAQAVAVKAPATVAYRLPGEAGKVLMTGRFHLMADNSPLKSDKEGFIMAPFSADYPILWLEANEIKNFGAENPFIVNFPESRSGLSSSQKMVFTNENEYLDQVNEIRKLLKSGCAGKVVLSRQILIPFEKANPLFELFDQLCKLYPDAFVYLASFPGYGLWIGATPETLLHHQNQTLKTMALAGTRPIEVTGEWSEKDREEHAFVADFINGKLGATGCRDIIRSLPYSVSAGKVSHLRTDFSARSERVNVAEIVEALHPTPAVCGWPSDKALEIIGKTEKHSRAYYTGYLGPVNKDSVKLFVNLRCMQLVEDSAIIYVGGGLTALSDPKAEWDETVLKSKTMLAAIEKMRNLAD